MTYFKMIPFTSVDVKCVTKMYMYLWMGGGGGGGEMKGNCNATEVYPTEASTTTSRKECHLLIYLSLFYDMFITEIVWVD
jgi:hypothetical protein